MNLKKLIRLIFLLALLIGPMSLLAFDNEDHGTFGAGNGGDFVRSYFIERGRSIIQDLTETEKGRALVRKRSLDVEALKNTLSTDIITVTDEKLFDNTGSVVDAVATYMSITLNKKAWIFIFGEDDADKLVFHEMLRAVSVNDKDYIISEEIYYITPSGMLLNGFPKPSEFFGYFPAKFGCSRYPMNQVPQICNFPSAREVETLIEAVKTYGETELSKYELIFDDVSNTMRDRQIKLKEIADEFEEKYPQNNLSKFYNEVAAQYENTLNGDSDYAKLEHFIREVHGQKYIDLLRKIQVIVTSQDNDEIKRRKYDRLFFNGYHGLLESYERAHRELTSLANDLLKFGPPMNFQDYLIYKNCDLLREVVSAKTRFYYDHFPTSRMFNVGMQTNLKEDYSSRHKYFNYFMPLSYFDDVDAIKMILTGNDGYKPLTVECKELSNIKSIFSGKYKIKAPKYIKRKHKLVVYWMKPWSLSGISRLAMYTSDEEWFETIQKYFK